VADAVEVVRHGVAFDLLGGEVAGQRFPLDELLQEDAHDLRLLAGSATAGEELLHVGQPHVVAVLHPVELEPLQELAALELELVLADAAGDELGVGQHPLLQPPEEHPQQVGIGVSTLFLVFIFHLLTLGGWNLRGLGSY
jgi:hypothetical protein